MDVKILSLLQLEQFRKTASHFCDKNCGKNKNPEHFSKTSSETKTALRSAILTLGGTVGLLLLTLTQNGQAQESTQETHHIEATNAENTVTPRYHIGSSGLALPRFVSLRSGRVNVRVGPNRTTHAVAWEYTRQGLPVEILEEFDNWRRIRDSEGDSGWVDQAFLSGKRTIMPAPWLGNALLALRQTPDPQGDLVAELEPTVIGEARRCTGAWCEIIVKVQCEQVETLGKSSSSWLSQILSMLPSLTSGDCVKNYRGWTEQANLWGIYPDEVF